ncbi:hypothetical protein BEP19_12845 [Ammoniphilus oxalaticus]|uniref:Polysaccharide pyruvyl transferase domain-containing protein n=1 Tax=Ammoniphilus oxalaticus TaxID=66863 RepID=A0A419SH49_9BACL|nr:polysaccharide pyruvyl transferase family protein [Ammoniphilus oxalaticus]RKD23106.1 hypothetical protein BEP19_12845 [Ammoniphilus oxalaticus]
MKIGLITFHNALNYGASLQTYATQKYLNELGHECVIIDYVNDSRNKAYDMKAQITNQFKEKQYKTAIRMAAGSFLMNLRRKSFLAFYSQNTIKTNKMYRTNEEARELNGKFDYFIVGSDQVWNPNNNGWDMAYLLNFVDEKEKTISYASSFGVSSIPDELTDLYSENLRLINHLSTREGLGVELIKNMTGRDAKLVLDPVFLLDRDRWIKLAKTAKDEKGEFLFVYTNRSNQFERMVKTTDFDVTPYKIHKISRFLTPWDFINSNVKVDYFIPPQKFLSNILNASLVATASFHCVAFAILFQKKFVAFLTGDEGRDERITNLLHITGLSHRIYNENMTSRDIEEEIDYANVERRLQKYVADSQEFLNNIFT